MFQQMIQAIFERRIRDAPEIPQSLEKAAAHYLGKKAKMETALDGVFTQQLHQISQDEVQTHQRYRDQKVFGDDPGGGRRSGKKGDDPGGGRRSGKKGDDPMGDFIVCDDYRKGVSPIVLGIVAVVAIIMAGLGGIGLFYMLKETTPAPPAQAPAFPGPSDTEYEVRFYDRHGNPIRVPHISERET